ncbi:MAG: glycosyltransferase family 1 protein [Alphaproteobacteria bacterium]|nr:glycosyltransferase family 1 protein [Alphaproteobacteria bacterium]
MRILIVTDAWYPQVNGVVRTLNAVAAELKLMGHEVIWITPEGRPGFRFPLYREITIVKTGARAIGREIDAIKPDCIHIATEGSLGWAARRACLRRKLPFTTSFHTMFAEYAQSRLPVPGVAELGWRILRHFHKPARAVMTPTASISAQLESRKFRNVKTWSRGVNRGLFKPHPPRELIWKRPILLYAGRLAIEKGIADFLELGTAGTKVLVGDGPQKAELMAKYPNAVFLGYRHDAELASIVAGADVLVFPSRTDTFGLVMLEAMACGTPVAAFNVPSPVDVVVEGETGALDANLDSAVLRALQLDRARVEQGSQRFSWKRTAEMFLGWLSPINQGTASR